MLPFLLALLAGSPLHAQPGSQVLLVVNRSDATSMRIAGYYRPRRSIPVGNVCYLDTTSDEEISLAKYRAEVERPIAACLEKKGLREKALYIVTTMGVPLKVDGGGSGWASERFSVDSELALLYGKLKGNSYPVGGAVPNPFFMQRDAPFRHPQFPLYMVARLAAWDFGEVKAMIDRSLAARNRGKFVIDGGPQSSGGNGWLRTAAMLLPAARVVADHSGAVLYGQRGVIGYAAWGSNDGERLRRWLGFQWLPGAFATEFVSTDGRTVRRPPDDWTFKGWNESAHMFGGSSQGLSADYIHEGATVVTGNAYEPYLTGCARPDYLLPAYYQGRTAGESFYLSVPFLSWQGVLFGDPLCTLGRP